MMRSIGKQSGKSARKNGISACASSHRGKLGSVEEMDKKLEIENRQKEHTNKISSKQPKSLFTYLLLTFRPLPEAFIRRSWY